METMRTPTTRKAMVQYLSKHFRYDTMKSWNNATSYAHNLKIPDVIPHELQDKAYELIEAYGFYEPINDLINDWNREQDYNFQAYFNGRSGGYLVFCIGGQQPSEHKSRCRSCGQLNYKTVEESGNVCGKCGETERYNIEKPIMTTFTQPGKSIDMGEDFTDWSIEDIRERVKLVMSFDKLAEAIIAYTIDCCKNCNVVEQEYTVTKTRKVIE